MGHKGATGSSRREVAVALQPLFVAMTLRHHLVAAVWPLLPHNLGWSSRGYCELAEALRLLATSLGYLEAATLQRVWRRFKLLEFWHKRLGPNLISLYIICRYHPSSVKFIFSSSLLLFAFVLNLMPCWRRTEQ